jgi:hypothetical protein
VSTLKWAGVHRRTSLQHGTLVRRLREKGNEESRAGANSNLARGLPPLYRAPGFWGKIGPIGQGAGSTGVSRILLIGERAGSS